MLENLKIDSKYDGFVFLAESARNPPALQPHRHVELEINLVASGAITYVVEGQRYRFERRSLLWFFPSQVHQLVDRTADAQYYVAVFKPEMLQRACRGERYAALLEKRPVEGGLLHSELEPDVYQHLEDELPELLEDGLDPDLLNKEAGFGLNSDFTFQHGDPDFLNAGLRHLLLRCWRVQSSRSGSGREIKLHPSVARAIDLLDAEPAEGDLASLAAKCGVSPSHLSRAFRAQVGVSLSRYRNSLKLGRFWKLFRSSRANTILDAALAAGFGSYAQFYRVFVEAYGKSPREVLGDR